MSRSRIAARLRKAQPQGTNEWVRSREGRDILAKVLSTPRQEVDPEHVDRRRLGRRTSVAAIAAAAVATSAALLVPAMISGSGMKPDDQSVSSLDSFRPADVAFFRHFQIGSAVSESRYFRTLGGAIRSADAIVIGEVVDVRQTRVITGEKPEDRIYMEGIVIRPMKVLNGSLSKEHRDQLTVEFTAGSVDPSKEIVKLKTSLPEGRSMWFLHSKADSYEITKAAMERDGEGMPERLAKTLKEEGKYYRVVSSQGLFVQGDGHVIDPIAGAVGHGMVAQGRSYNQLSALAGHVRELSQE